MSTLITSKLVALDDRPNFLPKHVGSQFLRYEFLTYDIMEKASADYGGGLWEFVELSNGGFYMSPDTERQFHIVWEDNYFDGVMSADAAGIGVSLMAQSWLSFDGNERLAEKFHHLRDYAAEHSEAAAILGFID